MEDVEEREMERWKDGRGERRSFRDGEGRKWELDVLLYVRGKCWSVRKKINWPVEGNRLAT